MRSRRGVLLLAVALLALGAGCRAEEAAPTVASPEEARSLGYIGGPSEGQQAPASAAPPPAPPPAPGAPPPAATPQAPRPAARKLVRTVTLVLEVRDAEQAAAEARQVAARLGGYVAAVEAHRRGDLPYVHLTLRIPADRLDTALAAVRRLAVQIEREQQSTEDVTDRWVDLDARLRTLLATERELLALLAESRQRGRTVEEILAVYRELTGIRSQIEEIQAQKINLERLAALSTLRLELRPTEAARPVVDDGWRPGDTARQSVRALLGLLRRLGDLVIYGTIVVLPVALAVGLLVVLLRRLLRRPPPRPEEPAGDERGDSR